MSSPPDISSLHSAVTSALVSTTRTVSELCSEDLSFHRSLDPQAGQGLDRQNARLLELAERLINNAGADSSAARGGSGRSTVGVGAAVRLRPKADDEGGVAEVIDGSWSRVVEVVDGLLEKADASLDEYTGVVKRGKMQGPSELEKVD